MIVSEFPPGPGGIGNHAFNLAKYLELNKVEVKVLAISDFADENEKLEFDRRQNFEIERFKRYNNRIKNNIERFRTVLKTLDEHEYSHLIFSGRYSLMTSLLLSSYRKKIKFISIVHGGDINTNNPIEQILINKALKNSDLIIPVSNFSRSMIKVNLPAGKIAVIPNGFDFENIEQLYIKEKNLTNGNLNLVTVGTVWPRKGHHNVINALPEIISEYPQTKYNIVGLQADLSKVKNSFEDERLKNNIIVHGSLPNEEMHQVLNQSQIFILLSESQASGDFEGFGIAVIEANYFGLPAIGSKNSGLEDSINNGVSGILVNPKDPDEILEAIKTISKNYSKFSEDARQWAERHHWSNIIKKYMEAIGGIDI